MSDTNTPASNWAVIELMGHIRYGGLVSQDTQLGTPLLRVEVPQADGSFVSQLVNPSAIYRITMCSEEIARHAAKSGEHQPLNKWELPAGLLDGRPGAIEAGDHDESL